jgi:YkoY family integral membrane protein
MVEYLEHLFGTDIQNAAAIIFNLILIESLLSVDNAAVLATMVMDLKNEERKRALRYGIIGAYVFRGLSLIFVSKIVQIWWLKPLGGLYLLYLTYDFFKSKNTPKTSDDTLNKEEKWFYRLTNGVVGTFWATVIAVEIMDMAFSLDNVLAAVAFSENIYLVITGVFIGILAMRFVAQYFVDLIEKYPFLEYSAFLVIGILGIKLVLSAVCHYYIHTAWAKTIESETADLVVSIITAGFFFVPLLTARLFGWPKRRIPETNS